MSLKYVALDIQFKILRSYFLLLFAILHIHPAIVLRATNVSEKVGVNQK
jgi:hypothetical protein